MDFFECPYYSMSRKLLLFVGQWPFQHRAARITKQIIIYCIGASAICVQIVKVMTSQLSMNATAEVVTLQIGGAMCAIKYVTFSIQQEKIKLLLKNIRSDWNCLDNDGDRMTAQACAEEGRKFNLYLMVFMYLCASAVSALFALQPLVNVIIFKNETRENMLMFPAEYFVDDQKYYCPITLHMTLILWTSATVLAATDTMYVACVYHACGTFNVISYRLEHAFDNCKAHEMIGESNNEVRRRIASAVECHETASQFVEVLVSIFNIPLLLVTFLVFCNISVTLYWVAMSLGKISEVVIALLFGAVQVIQTLFIIYPCQKVITDSSAVHFNAYSGRWYEAPFKIQTLILPILQRTGKPTMITVCKIIVITMETFAQAIQLSLSYFTVLLSVV